MERGISYLKTSEPVLVILAGGCGERFWPCSRRSRPKQLLKICSELSLLQETVARVKPLTTFKRIWVVTNQAYVAEVRRQLPELIPDNLLGEPQGCNTAVAVGLSLAYIKKRYQNEEPLLVIMPCDSLVYEPGEMTPLLKTALKAAQDFERIMIVGIPPSRVETGYGYIHLGSELQNDSDYPIYQVNGFKEKPDHEAVETYLSSGEYLWNGGVVVGKVEQIIKAFQEHLPKLAIELEKLQDSLDTDDERVKIQELYRIAPKISFDHAILEQSMNLGVIKAHYGWDDLGNWTAMERWLPRDATGNVSKGEHIGIETYNCNIFSPQKVVVTLGVSNLIIVATEDVLMVCAKERSQDIGDILNKLRENGRDSLL